MVAMIVGAAVALYPNVLPASEDPRDSLTIYNAASSPESLRLALYWWIPGIAVAIAYFVLVYRMFRGKATLAHSYGSSRDADSQAAEASPPRTGAWLIPLFMLEVFAWLSQSLTEGGRS